MNRLHVNRLTAIAAISGALFLFIGTFLHPMEADPNVPGYVLNLLNWKIMIKNS
jgi:hypothetical protein